MTTEMSRYDQIIKRMDVIRSILTSDHARDLGIRAELQAEYRALKAHLDALSRRISIIWDPDGELLMWLEGNTPKRAWSGPRAKEKYEQISNILNQSI